MKIYLFVIINLLFVINISAQTSRKEVQLSGFIAEKYAISMTLAINNDDVVGYYYYEKYKTKILLEGKIVNEQIYLQESPDVSSDFTMGFRGALTASGFKGFWLDKNRDKSLSCSLEMKSEEIVNLSANAIDGTYESEYNSDSYSGHLKMKKISGNFYYFNVSVGTASACTGNLKGIATFNGAGNGNYTGKACKRIDFTASNNTLELTEKECNMHGMQCSFEGKYQKTDAKDF
ncbi:hypothetical protein [Flammeovirga aprica]|uniref:Uncharacterized protein n=1 Tax=Flammeovirga aprica JL-4 TaxID=694437 RepID=A0A7X9P2C0_9BACT|nr:hypothetical protein [Flammeovirga aprica]NME67122.1 hypothetical protein [Flammeovirga aprica JL-4]